jgi:hypothetical protein
MSSAHATLFGVVTGIVGPALLMARVDATAAALALANIVLYAGVYTPLKQMHPINTWVHRVSAFVCSALRVILPCARACVRACVSGGLSSRCHPTNDRLGGGDEGKAGSRRMDAWYARATVCVTSARLSSSLFLTRIALCMYMHVC